MSNQALEFTGERFTPECVREIWYEHWHRYAWVASWLRGSRVLDAACGEGYGSAMLSTVADSVTGLDLSAEAVAHASRRYSALKNLAFARGDAAALELPDSSVDTVVSFETLEHLEAQQDMVCGFARVLREDGLLVISSPDKAEYSDRQGYRNEFHVKELYRAELLELLHAHFPVVRLYGHKLLFQSAIWRLDSSLSSAAASTWDETSERVTAGLDYAPMYFIAVCARNERAIPARLADLHLFGDRGETVYSHYHHEIRKNMQAGAVIAERDAQIAQLRSECERLAAALNATTHPAQARPSWLGRWFTRRR